MENVNPAGVNSDEYFADIAVIVCPLSRTAFDRTFSRIMVANETRLPPQSSIDRSKRTTPSPHRTCANCVRQDSQRVASILNAKKNRLRQFAIDIDLGVEGHARQAVLVLYGQSTDV